jgi:hypothetical protein
MNTHDTQQAGFDFGSPNEAGFAEDPPGTWLEPSWSSETYRSYFTTAEQALLTTPALLQPLFRDAIEQARSHLCDLDETCEDDGSGFSLPRIALDIDVEADAWRLFVRGCTDSEFAGVETVARQGDVCAIFAAHVAGIGSLVARRWSANSFALDYEVGRAIGLRVSFSDSIAQHMLSAAVWRPYNAAQRVAESSERPASVRALTHQGRRYVVTGVHSHRGRSEGSAWMIVAANEWLGPTYNYRAQCKCWDEGRTERGDRRGLLVIVDKQLCVLSSPALFLDQHDTHACDEATDADAGGSSATTDEEEGVDDDDEA